MKALLLVFVGGGLGSCCRFLLSAWLNPLTALLPAGTLLSNALSCVVMGYIGAWYAGKISADDTLRWLLMAGFCGGFSTFSTFSNELLQYLKTGAWMQAFGYVAINVCVSLLALLLGGWLAKISPI